MRNENMIEPQNPQCVQAVVTGCFSSVVENVIVNTGSDFSGVGAFDQALERLGIKQNKKFACDMDKYARQTYIYNYGVPAYYPENVYDREIPKESLDIYMTSPPCQSFSLAGKRKGEDSKNGVLFYNSHEFIVKNNPRYFIFENVKGLLSDDSGKTFQKWIDYLGGKSVNGNPVIFPHEESVPYHVYYQVMNAKHYGVPQNRERIFIIGIRDDADNYFSFPKPFNLTKRLKDVLESEVDEKYFLSDKMLNYFDSRASNFNNGNINFKDEESVASTITSSSKSLDISDNIIRLANVNPSGNGMNGNVYGDEGVSPTLSTNKGEGIKIGAIRGRNPTNPLSRVSGLPTEQMLEINENGTSNALTTVQKDNVVVIPANNSKGYDIAEEEEDSINFSNPNSETRRGRVGHGVAQTLDTACNQGVLVKDKTVIYDLTNDFGEESPREYTEFSPALRSSRSGLATKQLSKQQLEKLENLQVDENVAGCITNAIGRAGSSDEYIASVKRNAMITQRIRRLTPLECFRLMDFNENFKWNVSDSQAYKQAGNSIVVSCLVEIIKRLDLRQPK